MLGSEFRLSRGCHKTVSALLIISSLPTTFCALGALLRLFVLRWLCCPLDLKVLYTMCQKHTGTYLFTRLSGQGQWFRSQAIILLWIRIMCLECLLHVKFLAVLVMQQRTFCARLVLVPCQNGLTTISFCVSCSSILISMKSTDIVYTLALLHMASINKWVATFGGKAKIQNCSHRNLMKTCFFLCRIYLQLLFGPKKTLSLYTALQMLTPFLGSWVYHEKSSRIFLSLQALSLLLVLASTLTLVCCSYRRNVARSTLHPLHFGTQLPHMIRRRQRSFTASFSHARGLYP